MPGVFLDFAQGTFDLKECAAEGFAVEEDFFDFFFSRLSELLELPRH